MPRADVAQIPFATLYPLLVAKAVKKGRTREEVDRVTGWLTGYTPGDLAGWSRTAPATATFSGALLP